jgi:hypothetical protein
MQSKVPKGLATWAGVIAAVGQYAGAVAVFLAADDQALAIAPLVTATGVLWKVIEGRMRQAQTLAALDHERQQAVRERVEAQRKAGAVSAGWRRLRLRARSRRPGRARRRGPSTPSRSTGATRSATFTTGGSPDAGRAEAPRHRRGADVEHLGLPGRDAPNGGLIGLRACVWHIPVVANVDGRGDFDTLRRVLLQQGLMVQFATDSEGNVALYTRANRLCYQARGGNQITCGVEQMHMTTGEPWSRKQLRAGGWIANYLEREFGIPLADGGRRAERAGPVPGRADGAHVARADLADGRLQRPVGPGRRLRLRLRVPLRALLRREHGTFVGA